MSSASLTSAERVYWLVLALVCPIAATADTFVLRNGATIQGKATVSLENGRRVYRIQLEPGIEFRIHATDVAEHNRQSQELADYEQIAPTFGDTRDEQWALAEWCRERKLDQQRRSHLRRVVELDPTDAAAWRALGYTEIRGKWQTQDEFFEERGYVFYRGRWRLAQEVDVLEERKRIEQLERDWIARLKTLRSQLGTERKSEAVAGIRAIQDPLAIPAIAEQLRRERSRPLRILYLEALGNIQDRRAVELLVKTALSDPDIEVFHAASDELVSVRWSGLAKKLVPALEDSNNVRVNRSAYILGRLGDREVMPALIQALVTTHYAVQPGSGRTTATLVKGPSSGNSSMSAQPSLGGDAFSVGDATQVSAHRVSNQQVLQALVSLSGQSFGFDQRAWMNWWTLTTTRVPDAGPLR